MTFKLIRHEGYYLDPQSTIKLHRESTAPEGTNPRRSFENHISLNEQRISFRLKRDMEITMHGMCSASDLPNEANVIVVMQIIGEQIAIGNYLARVNDLYCANNIRSIIKGDAILEYFCLVSRV